ncbi:MAG: hypothetical protein ACRCX7_14800 [Cetobacterium sp.]|uniref:hypothetical protein n=1 Tax=Cetobacterium sp. TaxID=2071632 RepID=UPI003F2BC8CD
MALRKIKQDDSFEFLSMIHGNSKGWICRAEKGQEGFKQYHYKYLELLEQDLEGENIYISGNTFYKPCRRIEFVKELNVNYIDLDTYKTKLTKEQILMDLEENHFNKTIPRPTFIIDSGRGMYLEWKINSVPSMALPLWKAVQEYLYSVLKSYGADRQALDCTRVLRPVGSKNAKSDTVVSILGMYDYIYDLREIQKEFLPELKPKEKTKGRPKKVNYIYRERSLYFARIQDIIKLCELREYDLKGHRELILFLYRYYLCSFKNDTEKALQDVLELNSEFKRGLSEREVVRATRSAERCYLDKVKEYKYKNETLIDLLEISEEEQKYMKTIISKGEFTRRKEIRDKKYYKNNYDTKERQKKYHEQLKTQGKITGKERITIRRNKVKDLMEQGLKQKDICLELDISKRNCIRDIKYLREQGLL